MPSLVPMILFDGDGHALRHTGRNHERIIVAIDLHRADHATAVYAIVDDKHGFEATCCSLTTCRAFAGRSCVYAHGVCLLHALSARYVCDTGA